MTAEPASPSPASAPVDASEIIEHYVEAVHAEQTHLQPVSMEVDMDATLPRLKKQGRFHALRFMSRVGKIFYSSPRFEGDNTIKKEVIARYLQAEKDARAGSDDSLSVTPDNYKFKFKGITDYAGQPAYVFQVSPKKNNVGRYKGELWIAKDSYLPLRQWGVLSKSPSVFLKSVYFVRDFTITNGMSVPRRVITDIRTRVVGDAQLTIWYENVKVGDSTATTARAGGMDTPAADGGVQ